MRASLGGNMVAEVGPNGQVTIITARGPATAILSFAQVKLLYDLAVKSRKEKE